MIYKENLTSRAVRIKVSKWNALVRIAEKQSEMSGKKIRPSDLIRHAIEVMIMKG